MSTLNVTNISDGTDTTATANVVNGSAKAWVNFDGTTNTGGNCDIRESYNVSTVADNGAGDYTINFTAALTDSNYAFNGMQSQKTSATNTSAQLVKTHSASSIRINTVNASNVAGDAADVCVVINR